MNSIDRRREQFLDLADRYQGIIAKVCSIYASGSSPFADLYQEVMINLWNGLESFRGDAKITTWIYRIALNTCLSSLRRNQRHSGNRLPIEAAFDIADTIAPEKAEIEELYRMISKLEPIDKALITLWLDEKSYDEISAIVGISKANVATRLFRAKQRLSKMAETL